VLLAEDDLRLAAAVLRGLRGEGMVVDVAPDGDDALRMARSSTEYDAMVLDVMLPGTDGLEVCRSLRSEGFWVPIIMLTAREPGPPRRRGR